MSLRKLLTSKVGAAFIIIPFIKPASEITGAFDAFFDIWKIISIVLIMLGSIGDKGRIPVCSKISLCIYGVQICYIVSTVLNMGDIKTALVDAASNISLCYYMEYLVRKKGIKIAARNFAIPCVTLGVITALTMYIYYPYGMYVVGEARENYLWGFDNTSAFRFIPTLYFLSIYSIATDRKRQTRYSLLFFVFCTSAFIYVKSLTAGIMMVLFTAAYLMVVVADGTMRVINTRNVVIVVTILSAIIILYKNDLSQLMEFAAKNDKFGSLSLRFTVWRKTIEQWTQNPFLGLGVEHTESMMNKIILDHPHNLFLDVLYHGGIPAFVCLLYTLGSLVMVKQTKTKANMITAIALLSLLIVAQMDFYNAQYLFYPTILLGFYSINRKIKQGQMVHSQMVM